MFYFQQINSVLVPTVDEEKLLARIIDVEPEYHREGSTSDRWNYWLNVKQKKIWWKELYESDVAARVFKREKDNEKVTIEEGSSSNSGLELRLKGLEERIVKAMEGGFSGLNLTVETKLDAMNLKMGELERNQRLLRRRVKKIEDMMTSIEKKGQENYFEDMDFGQTDYRDNGRSENAEAEKKNSENGGKEEENMEKQDQEPEKDNESFQEEDSQLKKMREERRVEADDFWRRVDEQEQEELAEMKRVEAEKKSVETPTPPRGRTKAAAARRSNTTSPEEWIARKIMETKAAKIVETEQAEKPVEESSCQEDAEKVVEEESEKEVEEEKKDEEESEKEVEEEKKDEEEHEKEVEEEKKDEEESEKEVEEEKKDEEEHEKEVEEEKKDEEPEEEVEEEKKDEEEHEKEVEEHEEEPEIYTEEEKQGWLMVVYEGSTCEPEEAAKPDELPARIGKRHRPKVMAVKGGITRTERLAKMKETKEKAQATPKKRGRPKKTAATLKPCTPLPEKRKGEPSRWVQSPFTEGKTDELEVPKKKLKTKA